MRPWTLVLAFHILIFQKHWNMAKSTMALELVPDGVCMGGGGGVGVVFRSQTFYFFLQRDSLTLFHLCAHKKLVSTIRKYHIDTLLTNPRHCEEEPQNT